MLVRFGNLFLIIALLTATGAHWAALQSVAWTRMLAYNLRNGPVTEAIEKTFDGKHACGLCIKIKEGRKSEKKSQFSSQVQKLEFIAERISFVLIAPEAFVIIPAENFSAPQREQQPLQPPPKTIVC